MALSTFARQTVTRLRPKTDTQRGSVIFDWSSPTELVITGCSVQPAGTSLSEDGRVLGISEGITVYLPEGSDVIAGDRIRYNGHDYTINGEPKIWISATGRCDSIQLNCERWYG
jgi:hypothetical protein